MPNAGKHDALNVRDLDFELLRRAFLTLAEGLIVQAGDEGRDFLRLLESSIQEFTGGIEPDRLDAQASADFDRAATRVRAVLQEALRGKAPA